MQTNNVHVLGISITSETNETIPNQIALPEKKEQQIMQKTFKSLTDSQLLKIYTDTQFFQELLSKQQAYPRQIDQILWKMTYLLGQILLDVQSTLIQEGYMQNSVILSVKQIKEAAFKMVELQLTNKNQNAKELRQVKQRMLDVFEKGRVQNEQMARVYNFVIRTWKRPLEIKMNLQPNKPIQSAKAITEPNYPSNTKTNAKNLNFYRIATFTISFTIQLFCLQIRRAVIELPFNFKLNSYLDLSRYIVDTIEVESDFKAILYNKKGQPFLYNLDLMHSRLSKLDLAQPYYVIFTRSPSTVDEKVKQPDFLETIQSKLAVVMGTKQYTLSIDLQNTLSALKYKIFTQTRIHPKNQIIKYANKLLLKNSRNLKQYGIAADSVLQLSFKLNSNLVPSDFADKFFYKDINHTREQNEQSLLQLRSNLLALTAHLSDIDKLKMVTFIRGLTHNMPLTYAFKCLFSNCFMSQAHRIALQEGLLLALSQYIQSCTTTPQLQKLQYQNIFLYFRDFMDFVLEGLKKIINIDQIQKCQQSVQVQVNCYFTAKPIKIPRLDQLDNAKVVLVDKDMLEDQILQGFDFPLLKSPKKDQLFATKDLEEFYFLYQLNQIDNPNTKVLYWIGFVQNHPEVVLPEYGLMDKYKGNLDAYVNMKVHQPQEIKNKQSIYLLLRNNEDKLRVFVSKNKDIANLYNIFNVLTGEEEEVDLDLMLGGENFGEMIDVNYSVEKLVDEVLGKNVDDGQRKQKEKKLLDWFRLTKNRN